MRTVFSLWTLVVAVSLCACSGPRATDSAFRLIAAPGDAVSVAAIGSNLIAFVGGDALARVVTIEQAADGTIVRRFGVPKEAVAIGEAPDAGVYVAIAAGANGAVEDWGVDGHRRRILAMPAPVVGLATSSAGPSWALIRNGDAFAAVRIERNGTSGGRSIPLPAETTSIASCGRLREPSLVVSAAEGRITLVRIADGATTETGTIGAWPVCSKVEPAIFAIARVGQAANLSIIGARTLLTIRQEPTMRDAAALATADSGDLFVLGKGQGASAVRVYPHGTPSLRVDG